MKLNDKKIKYIIREKNKRRSSTEIANGMKITTRHVNYIYKKYKDNGEYTINKRKNKELNNNDIEIIKKIRYKYPLSGPERIRKYLNKINIKISKNNIYKNCPNFVGTDHLLAMMNQRRFMEEINKQ